MAADTGAIGGDRSHEFQVIADTGEDAIVYCPDSDYAANIELAEALALDRAARRADAAAGEDADAGQEHLRGRGRAARLPLATHREVAGAGHRRDERAPATSSRRTVWLLLVRGDHALNEVKAGKVAGPEGRLPLRDRGRDRGRTSAASRATSARSALKQPVKVVADRTVAAMSDFVCGANEADFHSPASTGAATCPSPTLVADIRNVVAGDPSPDGKGVLAIQRGIEVGHVF